jgi:hypothetical protein
MACRSKVLLLGGDRDVLHHVHGHATIDLSGSSSANQRGWSVLLTPSLQDLIAQGSDIDVSNQTLILIVASIGNVLCFQRGFPPDSDCVQVSNWSCTSSAAA